MTQVVYDVDVLIVGGGGAGFRAAIGAKEKGANVLLLSKGPMARCGATPMAGADYTLDGQSLRELGFFGEPIDSKETFFNDIVYQGYYLNNQVLLEQYVNNAQERLKELLDWGISLRKSEERAIFTSGIGIMDALMRRAKKMDVEMLEDVMLLDLVVREERVAGALGLDIKTGQFIRFRSKAIVVATGGWHKAFWPNTGMRDLSGEGIAMAHRAGADIGNMEFITFCCNVLYSPPFCRGSIATYIMSLRVAGELTNSAGEAFLNKYDPYIVHKGTHMEWNKNFVSFATMQEVRNGKGSPGGGVYYGRGDVSWDYFENAFSDVFPNWKYKAIDLNPIAARIKDKNPVEVGPAVEYFEGGIVVNERFETKIEGLYAAGECTLGPFGANRVCAAITEMLVHGADAGRNAGEYAYNQRSFSAETAAFVPYEEKASLPLINRSGIRPAEVRRKVQILAHSHLGPIRNAQELSSFIDYLENIKRNELLSLAAVSTSRVYNKEWIDAIELPNMVHLLECTARSALYRTESRGVHFREDFPHTDNDSWLKETIVKINNNNLEIQTRSPTITTLTPPQGVFPYLDMLKHLMESHSAVGGHH